MLTPRRFASARSLLMLAFTLPTAGCVVSGNLLAPPTGAQGGPSEDPPSSSTVSTSALDASDDRLAQLSAELKQMTFRTITADQLAIDKYHLHIFTPAGRTYEPAPPCGDNPNATWLAKWDPCAQMGHQALAAIVQAHINATYAAELDTAIEKERAAWKAFDADIAERLAKAMAIPSVYDRAPALYALLRTARTEMEQKKLPRFQHEEPGALANIAEGILKTFEDAGAPFALSTQLPSPAGQSVHALDLQFVRAWGTDEEEKTHFAAVSIKGAATDFIPALPLVETSRSASPMGWLKWPLDVSPFVEIREPEGPSAFEKKLRASATKMQVREYPHTVVEDPKAESMDIVLGGSGASKLVWVAGRVLRLENKGGTYSVELGRDEWKADTKCIAYGPITGYNASTGKFTRNEKCNNTNERHTMRRFRVTLADWPKKVDIGDMVVVFGDLQSVVAKGTKAKMSIDATLAGRFVGCFTPMAPVDMKAENALVGQSVPLSCPEKP